MPNEELAFYAIRLGYLCVFTLASYALGRRLLGPLGLRSLAEEMSFAIGLGLGVLATVFFVLGVLGAFRRGPVVLTLAVAVLSGIRSLRRLTRRLRDALSSLRPALRAGFLAGGLLLLLVLLAEAMYPPAGGDATMYHLPAAAVFASTHSVPVMPDLRYPVFPQLVEILWGAALLVGDDVLAQLLNVLFCLVIVAAIAGLGLDGGGPVAAAWSVGLWLASPIVFLVARAAYAEMALVAFVTLAIFAVLRWRECRNPRWLVAAGLLCGFAAGTKYHGLFFVLSLPFVVLVGGARGSRLRSAGTFVLAAFAGAVPWYGRSVFYSGNPVWPFLSHFFGYRFWTPTDVQSLLWSLRHEGLAPGGSRLLELPWDLVFHQPRGEGRLAPTLFALLPIGIAAGLARGWSRWVVALAAAYFVFWFYTTQQVRFLLPIVPLLCLLVALGCERGIRHLCPRAMPSWWLAAGVAGLLLSAGPQLINAARRVIASGPPPTSSKARDEYLSIRLPTYEFYRTLNAKRDRPYVVYAFHDEPLKYYCRGTQLGDWFGRGRYSDIDLRTGESLFRSVQGLGAEFLLVNSGRFRTVLPDDEFFRQHFLPVFTRPGVLAFELQVPGDRSRGGKTPDQTAREGSTAAPSNRVGR